MNNAIAVVSSPLQLATFRGFNADKRATLVVGNRGMPGDITYAHSVLNDPSFLPALDSLLTKHTSNELFIPNSLNLVFFFAAAHPHVKKISFVDEGRLTQRFLATRPPKPTGHYHVPLVASMHTAMGLPQALRKVAYQTLAIAVRKHIVRRYEKNTADYPYTTIERRSKPGVVLTHIPQQDPAAFVRQVDVTKGLKLPRDLEGQSCLFLHPKYIDTPRLISAILGSLETPSLPLLVRPHPNFTRAPDLLRRVMADLSAHVPCRIAPVSEELEVAVELHARGVEQFFCGATSITDTVEAYPDFFRKLRIVII